MRGLAAIRAVNAVLSVAMIALFAVHAVGNSLQLIGAGTVLAQWISFALLGTVAAHAVIGVVLTAVTLREQRRAGTSYFRENKRFWAVRISGLAMLVLIALHVAQFGSFGDGPLRLQPFEGFQLVMSLLLVASLAVHVFCNAEPLLVSLGIGAPGSRALDVIVAVSLIVLLAVAAFVVYYIRWSTL